MTLLHESVDFKKLDVRMIERNVARGVISAEDVQKAASKLPDDAENAEWVSIESIEGEGDDSEGGDLPNGHATHH
jgi:hypothetical protein